ncbi:arylsulfatase B-like, partial [Saccoglossus kowalevskii]|uniref:Arylsulfatase B-like n=1 Tax=Saccoglossus kowalevskii TaxID=10224 RepID=A0ABM0MBV5_SACKO
MSISVLLTVPVLFLSAFARCDSQPNIVFIFADDYGWNDIGYHNPIFQTPNLNSLAADGIKLENYYVAPVCTPSRGQLLTGRYAMRYGLVHRNIRPAQRMCLPLDEVTLPEKMKQAGYATHMVGKWHQGFYTPACIPTQRGFDSFFGFYICTEDYFTHSASGGFDLKRGETDPLFLYLAYQSVHAKYASVPQQYSDLYNGIIEDERRRTLAGMVTCMDEGIGNITKTLKDSGIWDNTILIFSNDNGGLPAHGGNNWPLRVRESLYECCSG